MKKKKLNTEVEPKSSVESTPTEVQAVKGNVSIGNKISNNDLVMNQNFQTPTTGLDTLFIYIDDYLYFIAVLITALILIKYLRPVAKKLFTRHFNYVAINKYLSKHLSVDDYTLYSKISLPIPSGMADIDELVLSPYGVFVISCQPQTGRIYADTTSEVWSEQIGKNRNNFPSPSRQLPMKLAGVKQLFGIEEHIHGLIVFDQEADFRTNMPKNVFQTGQLLSRIQSYEDKIFTQEQISHFVLLLSEYKSSNPFKDLFSKLGEKKVTKFWMGKLAVKRALIFLCTRGGF
ncbi:NERD domain-containing protein [Pseudoalteromonas phenolica O-BC30]|nr:NERD domain-containing protein [Pseudoalteromonas phenolica O-BC30]